MVDEMYSMTHPGRLTWNLQVTHLEKKQMIFQTSMILFHVNLQGCKQDVVFLFGFAISTIIQLNPLMLTDLLIRSIRQAINTTVVDIIALNYNPLYSVIFTTLFFAHFFM